MVPVRGTPLLPLPGQQPTPTGDLPTVHRPADTAGQTGSHWGPRRREGVKQKIRTPGSHYDHKAEVDQRLCHLPQAEDSPKNGKLASEQLKANTLFPRK